MKKSRIIAFFATVAAVCLIGAITACKPNKPGPGPSPNPPPAGSVSVTFVCANQEKTVTVEKGKTVSAADFPEYVVLGWQTESGTSFDFNSPLTADVKLIADCYSKGLEVEDGAVVYYGGTGTAVIIPSEIEGEKITAIGKNVFYENLEMYDKIVSVSVAEGITRIDDRAFNGLEAVETVFIPASVTYFGRDCFIGCPKLLVSFAGNENYPKDESGIVYTDSGKTAILFYAGERGGDVTLSLQNVAASALLNAQIGKLTLTSAVRTVGNNAFANSSVTEVIWNSLANVPVSAFSSCASLEKITIAEGVTEIGANAFNGATALKQVNLPVSLAKLGSRSFANCASLTEIDIENTNITSITGDEFRGAGLKSFSIPAAVDKIADGMFTDWRGLESVDFGNVTSIGKNAFQNCTSLKSVVIPAQVEVIYEAAFAGCASLESVQFENGSKLKVLGETTSTTGNSNVFTGTAITSLVLPDSLTEIKMGALSGISRLTNLSIPFTGTYSTGKWKEFLRKWNEDTTPTQKEGNPNLVAAYEKYCMGSASNLEAFLLGEKGGFSNGQLFGYIFGTSPYAGGTECQQVAAEKYPGNTYTYKYYVPTTLKNVKITGQSIIPAYTFNKVSVAFELDKTSSVSRIGAYAFSYCLKYDGYDFGDNLTYIGDYAFDSCYYTSPVLEIPDSVSYVGAYAFRNNLALTEVKLPDRADVIVNKGAFFNDSYREGVIENNKIYTVYQNPANKRAGYCTVERGSIGSSVFYQCVFEHAVLGDEVKFITSTEFNNDHFCGVFNNCRYLKTVKMTDDLTDKVSVSGEWTDILPANIFNGCTSLVRLNSDRDGEFNIPRCSAIAYGVFNGVVNLKKVNLPADCQRIGDRCFAESGLQSLDMRFVRVVGGAAFYRCYELAEITWGSGITEFIEFSGVALFEGCTKLSRFNSYDIASGKLTVAGDGECHVPAITVLPRYGFKTLPIRKVFLPDTLTALPMHAFYGCGLIESITLPANVTRLGDGTFINCVSLKEVIFECKDIKTIPANCFNGCAALEEFIVPEGVTTIDTQCFANCSSLKKVVIPASVTRFEGNRQFANCPSLQGLWLLGNYPPNVDAGFGAGTLFFNSSLSTNSVYVSYLPELMANNGFRIYVPADSLQIYKKHNSSYSNSAVRVYGWKNYAEAFAPVYTGFYADAGGKYLRVGMSGFGEYFAETDVAEGKYEMTFANGVYSFAVGSVEYSVTFSDLSATVSVGGSNNSLVKLSGVYFDYASDSPSEQFTDLFNKQYPETSKPLTPEEAEKLERIKQAEKAGLDGILEALEGDDHFRRSLELTADGKAKFTVFWAFRQSPSASQHGYMGYFFTPSVLEGTYTLSDGNINFSFDKLLTYNGTLGATSQYHASWTQTVTLSVPFTDFTEGSAVMSMPAVPVYLTSTSAPRTVPAADYTFIRNVTDL